MPRPISAVPRMNYHLFWWQFLRTAVACRSKVQINNHINASRMQAGFIIFWATRLTPGLTLFWRIWKIGGLLASWSAAIGGSLWLICLLFGARIRWRNSRCVMRRWRLKILWMSCWVSGSMAFLFCWEIVLGVDSLRKKT
jgi:hypothetical protein